jgi:hypothetical protein
VVVARSASGAVAPSSPSSADFASGSSTIASITRSQPASSEASVVTLIRSPSPPSMRRAASVACSSARQADASLRASSRTSPRAEAQAASPHPITPLPAIPGLE